MKFKEIRSLHPLRKFREIWPLLIIIIVIYFSKESCSKSLKIFTPLTIELERQSKFDAVDGAFNEFLNIFQNFSYSIVKENKLSKEYLKNLEGFYYYGNVFIGTPAQKVGVLFDTGTADTVVPSTIMCKNKPYCKKHQTYNHNTSTSYQKIGKPFKISYGKGSGVGFTSQDNLVVASILAINQTFAELTNISYDLSRLKFDGILGMGFAALSQIPADPPFITLLKQNVIPLPVFSFYLSTGDILKSSITFGGVDPTRFSGVFVYTPVVEAKFWTILIDKIMVGDTQVVGRCVAIPDSGTSLMLGPPPIADAINHFIGGIMRAGYNFVDCYNAASLPSVSIYINGQPFPLDPVDYVKRTRIGEYNYCRTAFVGSPSLKPLIIGDVFMQRYYTLFDFGKQRVGFAPANQP